MESIKTCTNAVNAVEACFFVMLNVKVRSKAPTVLRVQDVAELCKVAPRTVRSWAQRGELQAFKVGRLWRFSRPDIAKLLERPEKASASSPLRFPSLSPKAQRDISGQLRDLLKLGVSQKEIAAALGVPQPTVSRWLSEPRQAIPERHSAQVWNLWRQVRRERAAQLIDAGSAKLLFPDTLTVEQAREILLTALSDPRIPPPGVPQGIGAGSLVAVFGENLYMILPGYNRKEGSAEQMLHELKQFVDRLQRKRAGS
jgi:excisionase family DNA binding protein